LSSDRLSAAAPVLPPFSRVSLCCQTPVLCKSLVPLTFDRAEGDLVQVLNKFGRVVPPMLGSLAKQAVSIAVPACLQPRYLRRLKQMYAYGNTGGMKAIVSAALAPAWFALGEASDASGGSSQLALSSTWRPPPLPKSGASPSFEHILAAAVAAAPGQAVVWAAPQEHAPVLDHPYIEAHASLAAIASLEERLTHAAGSGAIVVAAADAVKSLLLRALDLTQVGQRAAARAALEDADDAIAAAKEAAVKRAARAAAEAKLTRSGWPGRGGKRKGGRGAATRSATKGAEDGVAPSRDLARHCASAGGGLGRCVLMLRGEAAAVMHGSEGGNLAAGSSDTPARSPALLSGIALLDEVDTLMHPLRSELNYPTGAKEDLPLAPTRWTLPLVLLEAVLVAHARSCGTHRSDAVLVRALGASSAQAVLSRLTESVARGRSCMGLADVPHVQVRKGSVGVAPSA
jgi:hypothetical protein